MTKTGFIEMLDALAHGWTTRRYESVAAHFAERIFYSDAQNYCLRTNDELLKFFKDDDGLPQKCVFHRAVFDETMQTGAAEYTYEGHHLYHGTVWIKIAGEKIAEWREYQQTSDKNWREYWRKEEKTDEQ